MRALTALGPCKKLLLVEANDQRRWIGSRVEPEVHIPPLGLMALAAYARREQPGLEVRIIETSLDAPDDAAFSKELGRFAPDLVGVRGINVFRQEFEHTAALVKKWGKAAVIGGGPITSALKGELLGPKSAFDLLVKGEGERTLVELLAGKPFEETSGVLFRRAGRIVETQDRRLINDLNSLPAPESGLVDAKKYERHLSYAYNHRLQGVLSTSRGCPFRCTYCFTFGGKTARLRSADNVLAEMDALWRAHGIKDFYFIDDIFNLNPKRARELFARISAAKRGWRLYFVNGLRADIMTPELVDRMVDAGTVWVTYAIETAEPELQRLTQRLMDLDKAFQIINHAQRRGIVVNINTMYGFPTETPAMAQKTLDWLGSLDHPSVLPYHFCLRGYDGCEVVEQAERAGWDRAEFLSDNVLSYNAMPVGTPTFPRKEMLAHVIQYHKRLGMGNPEHMGWCLATLKRNGYTERDLLDMYTVLTNRPIRRLDELSAPQPVSY